MNVELAHQNDILLHHLHVALAGLLHPDGILPSLRVLLILLKLVRITILVLLKESVESGGLLITRLSILHQVVEGLLGQQEQVIQQPFVVDLLEHCYIHVDHFD